MTMGTRVFVGGIKDPRIRERDIEDFFKGELSLAMILAFSVNLARSVR